MTPALTPHGDDLLLRGGRVFTEHDGFDVDLVIRDGRVASWLDRADTARLSWPGPVVDAAGLYVLPGLIDTHAHIREPGYPEREDFASGTRAAAAGGFTTLLEMPISKPAVYAPDILANRVKVAAPQAYVDYGFYGAANGSDLENLRGLVEAGVVAFKTFMLDPQPGREDEFLGLCVTDDGELYEVFAYLAQFDVLHCIHAENNEMVKRVTARLRAAGRKDPVAHCESRPVFAELDAVRRCIAYAERTGVRLQIAHVSAGVVADAIHDAKAHGARVTAETCPHYLFLTDEDMPRLGPYGKINPPLRSRADQEGLWRRVLDGTIDVIGTDHSPYRPDEKARGADDIWLAPPGAPGFEQAPRVMLDAALRGRWSLPKLVELTSARAARLYGLAPAKGSLHPGADADFVLVDPGAEEVLEDGKGFSKASPIDRLYAGRTVRGRIEATYVRGRAVFRRGAIVAEPGWGRWLKVARPVNHVEG